MSTSRVYRDKVLDRKLRVERLEDRRLLAVFSVDNLNDSGAGSLRDAIDQANANGVADEITFNAGVVGTINIASQLPTISEDLTITGPGQTLLTIDAGDGADNIFATGDGYRIFKIDDGDNNHEIDVNLSGLTLTGGDTANGINGINGILPTGGKSGGAIRSEENLTLVSSAVTGNATGKGGSVLFSGGGGYGGAGGGIFSSGRGILVVTSSTISGNTTGAGGDSRGSHYGQYMTYPYDGGSGGDGGGIRSRGSLTITSSVVSGNTTSIGGNSQYGYEGRGGLGGGISAWNGLTLTNSTLSGNSTTGDSADGGGIHAFYGPVALTSSSLSGNSTIGSDANGGAIIIFSGTLTLASSTLSDNTTAGNGADGGGIYAMSGTLTLTNSTLSGNSTTGSRGRGGGISARSAAVTLTNSTLSGNSTSGGGFASGGAINSQFGAVTLSNSTLSGNSAEGDGGGISASRGTVTLNNSTVSGNSTMRAGSNGGGIHVSNTTSNATLTIENSIVANNTVAAGDTGPDFLSDPDATLKVDFSIIGDNTDTSLVEAQTPDANGNLIGSAAGAGIIDPLLSSLADNGGPTKTHALLAGSPAINMGDPAAIAGGGDTPLFDQRGNGFDRVSDGRIDMGAFEVQAAPGFPDGDYNHNGIADAADYTVWLDTLGSTTDLRADGNGNNVIDQADYDFWKANFGNTTVPVSGLASGTGVGAVASATVTPEPKALAADELANNVDSREPEVRRGRFATSAFGSHRVNRRDAAFTPRSYDQALAEQSLNYVGDDDLLLLATNAVKPISTGEPANIVDKAFAEEGENNLEDPLAVTLHNGVVATL